MSGLDDDDGDSLDLDQRELCPDGSCTGVVGRDGRCGECGRAGSGTESGSPRLADAGAVGVEVAAMPGEGSLDGEDGEDLDEEERRLCPDGTCVGLIGADGRCKVCGRAEAAPAP